MPSEPRVVVLVGVAVVQQGVLLLPLQRCAPGVREDPVDLESVFFVVPRSRRVYLLIWYRPTPSIWLLIILWPDNYYGVSEIEETADC